MTHGLLADVSWGNQVPFVDHDNMGESVFLASNIDGVNNGLKRRGASVPSSHVRSSRSTSLACLGNTSCSGSWSRCQCISLTSNAPSLAPAGGRPSKGCRIFKSQALSCLADSSTPTGCGGSLEPARVDPSPQDIRVRMAVARTGQEARHLRPHNAGADSSRSPSDVPLAFGNRQSAKFFAPRVSVWVPHALGKGAGISHRRPFPARPLEMRSRVRRQHSPLSVMPRPTHTDPAAAGAQTVDTQRSVKGPREDGEDGADHDGVATIQSSTLSLCSAKASLVPLCWTTGLFRCRFAVVRQVLIWLAKKLGLTPTSTLERFHCWPRTGQPLPCRFCQCSKE